MTTGFSAAVRETELAEEALASFDFDSAVTHLSTAIRQFTAEGDCKRAAMTCVQLGQIFGLYTGNVTAARAWFMRASRLVENEPPCIEQGWVAVAGLGCDVDDPDVLLAQAELALDRARRFGDVNLETKALADAGLAHVQAGRVSAGMALLDEAMALCCGPADDLTTTGRSVCSFFTACYYAADFERADSWASALRRQGLIGPTPGAPAFLANHCDAVQSTLLCELGRWGEAEGLLTRAIEEFETTMESPSWHAAIALAELRIRQGRLTEAEALLIGKDGHFQALLPSARLHFARGDHDLARATAARGLRVIGDDRLRGTELLALLVDIELAAGDLDAAEDACRRMVARATGLEVEAPGLQSRMATARAHIQAATGDVAGAITTIETALDHLRPSGVPLLRAMLLLDLVRLHERMGDQAAASVEAKRAATALAEIDVTLPVADLAVLERFGVGLGGPQVTTRPETPTATLGRDDRCWTLSYSDIRVRVPDTKGLRYLAELLSSPGVERHALDLVDRVEGVMPDGAGRRQLHSGDAGEILDAKARAEYRNRIEALRSEIDDALAVGAEEQAEDLQAELDALVQQLAQAFGLGGRARKASSVAERARLNVTRAMRAAIAKVSESLPEAGEVLDRGVRTGLYCVYEPDPADGVRWIVQSPVNGAARN